MSPDADIGLGPPAVRDSGNLERMPDGAHTDRRHSLIIATGCNAADDTSCNAAGDTGFYTF